MDKEQFEIYVRDGKHPYSFDKTKVESFILYTQGVLVESSEREDTLFIPFQEVTHIKMPNKVMDVPPVDNGNTLLYYVGGKK